LRSLLLLVLLFAALGDAVAQELKTYEQVVPETNLKFKMIAIPGGKFKMGSASSLAEPDERGGKSVTVSPFWMAEHELTFEQWDLFFKSIDVPQSKAIAVDAVSRPTAQYIDLTWGMGRDPKHPSNSMSQTAGIMYCKWLYEKSGVFFRLPTEAEWEYACRAGSDSDYPKGVTADALQQHGFFKINSKEKFQMVKQLKPNAWGLYDMLGNLSEWTLDQYVADGYTKLSENQVDPVAPPGAKYPRVARGGSFMDEAAALRCTNRIPSRPEWNQRDPQIPKSRWWLTDGMFMGLRIVRPLQQPSKEEIEKFFATYLK
jgi:formylglycine-generating enzyme required for sulfatase activity